MLPQVPPKVSGELACPAGIQLDGWKLLSSFRDGSGTLRCFDIRGLDRNPAKAWQSPVLEWSAPAQLHCFQAKGSYLLAGVSGGHPCRLWSFGGDKCVSTLGSGDSSDDSGSEGCSGTSPESRR